VELLTDALETRLTLKPGKRPAFFAQRFINELQREKTEWNRSCLRGLDVKAGILSRTPEKTLRHSVQ